LRALRVRISRSGLIAAAGIALTAGGASAAQGATLRTGKACYAVGQSVTLSGSGFADASSYVVTVDGIYFGESTTSSSGAFATSLRPGGLGANVAQSVDQLEATDGNAIADTSFTVTRPAGARFLASSGSPGSLRAPFEIWGFSLSGARLPIYLHYVSPAGRVRETVSLGHSGGQCGYLRTAARQVFPFTPSVGTWTFQIDTRKPYSTHPGGAVARIRVGVA
jgi:hypothetical protein